MQIDGNSTEIKISIQPMHEGRNSLRLNLSALKGEPRSRYKNRHQILR